MSTYTDLHNRVQESINVDYNSRITPQKVKLLNEENEYWGTFKGTIDVQSIDVNGGTLSGVTIKDAVLDGVDLSRATGLDQVIDLHDYAKQDDLNALNGKIDTLDTRVDGQVTAISQAAVDALNAVNRITHVLEDVDTRVASIRNEVNSRLNTLDLNIDVKIDGAKGELTAADSALSGALRTDLNTLSNAIGLSIASLAENVRNADKVSDREHADLVLSINLHNEITSLNHILDDAYATLVAKDTAISNRASEQFLNATADRAAIRTEFADADAALLTNIDNEETARTEKDNELNAKIDEEISQRGIAITDLSIALSGEVDNLSVALSGEVDAARRSLAAETVYRISEDSKLQEKIDEVSAASDASDASMSAQVDTISAALCAEIDANEARSLTALAHDRHYKLNADSSTVDAYPLIAEDMAVNVYDLNLADGKIIYTDRLTGTSVEVALINIKSQDPFEMEVKTYAGIQNDSIVSAIAENTIYKFDDENTSRPTGKNYRLEYDDNNSDPSLSAMKFRLIPDVARYHAIHYESLMIGKVYDPVYAEDDGRIIAGKYKIQVPTTSELSVFNYFDGISFDTTPDGSECTIGSERVTFSDVPTPSLKLDRDIDRTRFVSLLDKDLNREFGRIYEKLGNEAGVDVDDGVVTKIRVNSILPLSGTGYLRRSPSNNFLAVVRKDVPNPDDGKVYNYYLSATVEDASTGAEGISASFKAFKAAKLFSYPFLFTKLDGTDELTTSHVTPVLYNAKITDSDIVLPYKVKVDLAEVLVYDYFKRDNYELTKVPEPIDGFPTWTYSETVDNGSYINISYNVATLHIEYATPDSKEVVRHSYSVATVPDNGDAFSEDSITVLYATDPENPIDLSLFPSPGDLPAASYIAYIDSDATEDTRDTYDMTVDTSENDVVKIVIPDKVNYPVEISREMLVVLRMNTALDERPVEVRFINTNGEKIKYYNNKKFDIFLLTGSWTTLLLNEIKPHRFLVTDLNLNEDRLKFAALSAAISSEIETRTDETAYLSSELSDTLTSVYNNIADISWLSGELSDTVRYKGTVQLKEDYNPGAHPHDDHCHLSMLLSTCDKVDANVALENGYMFRCVVDNVAKIKNTFEFEEDDSGTKLCLDNNDYIILTDDMMLSDARISDVVVVKDFKNYIERLSAASDAKYAMLSGNNKISGENSISVLSADVLSVADFTNDVGKISSLSVDALSAGNEVAVDVNISSLTATEISSANIVVDNVSATTAVSATSATIVDASISSLTADDISVKTFANLTGNVSSFTAESAYVSAISATDLSVQKVVDISAYISNLIANDIYADALSGTKISANSLSGTNVSAENLSATDLSVSSLSTTDLSVNSLSGTDLSVSSLSTTDLSVNSLSGTELSVSNLSTTNTSAENLSGTNVSAEKLTVDYLTGTNVSVETFTDVSACISTLSANNISVEKFVDLTGDISSFTAESAYVSAISATDLSVLKVVDVSACISSLSVNALSDVIDNNTTSSLQDTVNDLDTRINTVSGIVDDALSANCELPKHSMTDQPALSAIVSKLLIVDEVTYDVYALTMRNGALNVDKVGSWPDAHPHPHSK